MLAHVHLLPLVQAKLDCIMRSCQALFRALDLGRKALACLCFCLLGIDRADPVAATSASIVWRDCMQCADSRVGGVGEMFHHYGSATDAHPLHRMMHRCAHAGQGGHIGSGRAAVGL